MTTPAAPAPAEDAQTLALLRNDLRGMSKAEIGRLVGALTERMGVDPALAPIDIIPTRYKTPDGQWDTRLSLYINARGAAELAKRHLVSDQAFSIDIRESPPVAVYHLTCRTEDGRIVFGTGASPYDPNDAGSLAKAIKTAETSAHRRATMRAVGIFLTEQPDLDTAADA